MIIIKNFEPNLLKIDKNSYKNIDIYNIRYVTMKDSKYLNIYCVDTLYLTIGEVDVSNEKKMKVNT